MLNMTGYDLRRNKKQILEICLIKQYSKVVYSCKRNCWGDGWGILPELDGAFETLSTFSSSEHRYFPRRLSETIAWNSQSSPHWSAAIILVNRDTPSWIHLPAWWCLWQMEAGWAASSGCWSVPSTQKPSVHPERSCHPASHRLQTWRRQSLGWKGVVKVNFAGDDLH